MDRPSYQEQIGQRLPEEPALAYLHDFLLDNTLGNRACVDRRSLARNAVVLEYHNDHDNRDNVNGEGDGDGQNHAFWRTVSMSPNTASWSLSQDSNNTSLLAIVLNYLDTATAEFLGSQYDITPYFFQGHVTGTEQFFAGEWEPRERTAAPPPRSHRVQHLFARADCRRAYRCTDQATYQVHDHVRRQRCGLLRSRQWTESGRVLLEEECVSVILARKRGALGQHLILCLCDPGIDGVGRNRAFNDLVRIVHSSARLAPSTDSSVITGYIFSRYAVIALALWNTVIFHMENQRGDLEDQLEQDTRVERQDPMWILRKTQRMSRRLRHYINYVNNLEHDVLQFCAEQASSRSHLDADLLIDMDNIKDSLAKLLQQTDKIIPALLASMTIAEGAKASTLTAVALWFAPLSLAVSIVSIDGDSRFGGKKYWIMACIAIPLLVMVILIASTSERLIAMLERRKMFQSSRTGQLRK